MKRTPIIVPGQVYLHPCNEYLVVVKANKGDIGFKGRGLAGIHENGAFLERFGPVNPEDLSEEERETLSSFTNHPLTTGWVVGEDDEMEDDE